MKYVAVLLCLIISIPLLAQKESYHWNFGEGAAISFLPNGNGPTYLTGSQLKSGRGCAAISDSCSGALLFYTNGDTIWDRAGNNMPNGFGLNGSVGSTQSAIIVAKPESSDGQFYVFTIETGSGLGLSYSIVDMNLNNGFGDVISTQKNINLVNPTQEKLTAVRHRNGKDIWIITHTLSSNQFYAFLLSSAGLANPIVSTVGPNYGNNDAVGYMKASPDGSKLALALGGPAQRADVYDFNNTNGSVSNLRSTGDYFNIAYGIEFSPDGSKLYVSDRTGIVQYDLNTVAPGKPLGDSLKFNNNKPRALQLGPDGRIYANEGWDLGVINFPNLPGAACQYVAANFTLSKFGNSGLPTFMQSFFSPAQIVFENICLGIPTQFDIQIERGIDSVAWNFGDPSSGVFNTSKDRSPDHLYGAAGAYLVTSYVFSSKCNVTEIDTVTTIVDIVDLPIPQVDLGNDTIICPGDNINLWTSGVEPSYLWNTGSTDTLITVSDPGVYWLTATNDCGGVTDSIEIIHFQSNITANIGPDTSVCAGERYRMSVNQEDASFLWSTGSTYHTVNVSDSGKYWVVVNDLCSTATDTMFLDFKFKPIIELGGDTGICQGRTVVLDATYPNSTYMWQDSSTSPTYEANEQGIYIVTVRNDCGESRDDVYIETEDCACIVFVPNAFTPNNDLINDFYSMNVKCEFVEFEISIMNRWGELVYVSEDPEFIWDGYVNGRQTPAGKYLYILKYRSTDPNEDGEQELKGSLNIIR